MALGDEFNIIDVLNTWADIGVFAYVLPFLLVFALVFGILSKTTILGQNKGVIAVIAVSTALLSLQFDIVTEFFGQIFPYFGVGLSVLLVAIILIGLLNSGSENVVKWLLFSTGTIIFFVIMYFVMDDYSGILDIRGGGFSDSVVQIIWVLVVIGAVVAVTVTSAKKSDKGKKPKDE